MDDQNSARDTLPETIATSRPTRKINPPAKLTDGSNSAIPALSSHRQGIAAHAAAQKKTGTPSTSFPTPSATVAPPSARSTRSPAVPQPPAAVGAATVGPTTSTLGPISTAQSTSHANNLISKRATVVDSEDEDAPPPSKQGRLSRCTY